MNYTWEIQNLKADQNNNIVQAYWLKTGTDDNGITGTFLGATPFEVDNNSEEYIPIEELTEEIVLSWVQAVVVGSYEEHVNKVIQEQINNKLISDVELPWAFTGDGSLSV